MEQQQLDCSPLGKSPQVPVNRTRISADSNSTFSTHKMVERSMHALSAQRHQSLFRDHARCTETHTQERGSAWIGLQGLGEKSLARMRQAIAACASIGWKPVHPTPDCPAPGTIRGPVHITWATESRHKKSHPVYPQSRSVSS